MNTSENPGQRRLHSTPAGRSVEPSRTFRPQASTLTPSASDGGTATSLRLTSTRDASRALALPLREPWLAPAWRAGTSGGVGEARPHAWCLKRKVSARPHNSGSPCWDHEAVKLEQEIHWNAIRGSGGKTRHDSPALDQNQARSTRERAKNESPIAAPEARRTLVAAHSPRSLTMRVDQPTSSVRARGGPHGRYEGGSTRGRHLPTPFSGSGVAIRVRFVATEGRMMMICSQCPSGVAAVPRSEAGASAGH